MTNTEGNMLGQTLSTQFQIQTPFVAAWWSGVPVFVCASGNSGGDVGGMGGSGSSGSVPALPPFRLERSICFPDSTEDSLFRTAFDRLGMGMSDAVVVRGHLLTRHRALRTYLDNLKMCTAEARRENLSRLAVETILDPSVYRSSAVEGVQVICLVSPDGNNGDDIHRDYRLFFEGRHPLKVQFGNPISPTAVTSPAAAALASNLVSGFMAIDVRTLRDIIFTLQHKLGEGESGAERVLTSVEEMALALEARARELARRGEGVCTGPVDESLFDSLWKYLGAVKREGLAYPGNGLPASVAESYSLFESALSRLPAED